MRREVLYAGATAAGLSVLVLAGLGVASLVDNDRSLERDEFVELVEARQPGSGAASEIVKWWAIAHRRRGEEIPSRGCGALREVTQISPPYRYHCQVSLRDEAGRYRGFTLTLVESRNREEFRIVRVRPRRAGPAGAQQQQR